MPRPLLLYLLFKRITPVLVIHNDSACQEIVKALSFIGYTAEAYAMLPCDATARPGEAALHALQHATQPSIVLVDPLFLSVPGNEELCDYLQNVAWRQPHVVYIARGGRPHVANFPLLHADGVLTQPFSLEDLAGCLADGECIIRQRQNAPPDPFTIDV